MHDDVTKKRCSWVGVDDRLMLQYHDREWGVPVHADRKHFEFLVLEGAQAGLSWTIEKYRRRVRVATLAHFNWDGHHPSLQLRVLRLGFLQDGDVGVGVFPEGAQDYTCGRPIRRSRSAKRGSERMWSQ
jgi:hypothetical protein